MYLLINIPSISLKNGDKCRLTNQHHTTQRTYMVKIIIHFSLNELSILIIVLIPVSLFYSTVTTLAKFLGLSTSLFSEVAKFFASNWKNTILASSKLSLLPLGSI